MIGKPFIQSRPVQKASSSFVPLGFIGETNTCSMNKARESTLVLRRHSMHESGIECPIKFFWPVPGGSTKASANKIEVRSVTVEARLAETGTRVVAPGVRVGVRNARVAACDAVAIEAGLAEATTSSVTDEPRRGCGPRRRVRICRARAVCWS